MFVFISYAHGDVDSTEPDRNWVKRIATFLRPAEREGVIELWWDESIRPGDVWDDEITVKLDEAAVAILLVSPRFLASDYIYYYEMPRLLARRSSHRTIVIPLILETYDLEATFNYPHPRTGPKKLSIPSLQAVNDPSEPLAALKDQEAENQIFMSLVARIRELAKDVPRPDTHQVVEAGRQGQTRVLVAGSGIPSKMNDKQRGVAHALGVALVENGFGLVSGGWEGVDDLVTTAFLVEHERRGSSPDESLLQVVQRGWTPPHELGEIIIVEPGDSEWVEQIVRSDAIVLIGGLGGTWTTGELGYAYGKPVLPLADTGEDAKRFYDYTIGRWDEYPMRKMSHDEFKGLSKPVPLVLKDVMSILRRIRG